MRFFKYLVFLFLSILTSSTFAELVCIYKVSGDTTEYQSLSSACASVFNISGRSENDFDCKLDVNRIVLHVKGTTSSIGQFGSRTCTEQQQKCPTKNWPIPVYFPDTDPIPTKICKELGTKFCSYSRDGDGVIINSSEGRKMVTLFSDSEEPQDSCTEKKEGQCDRNDPYGKCYTPPDDNCTRQANGSIICPFDTPPTSDPQGCKNGATYCDRPPQGCGPDYVTGSFNGKQLCVKKGPNAPPNPDKPNDCTVANCPKPDDSYDCPVGYYATTYNGQKICVKDNPNNSDNPKDPTDNPNDPNTSPPTGGGNGNGSGDGNGNGDIGNIGGGTGTGETSPFCETTGKVLCDAINEIKDGLKKIFSDEGKEEIEQLGEQSTDSRLTAAETEMTSKLQSFANALSYSSSHACISDLTVTNIPHFGFMTVPLSKWCDLLALVKLMLKLAVLMLALRMIDATVRAF